MLVRRTRCRLNIVAAVGLMWLVAGCGGGRTQSATVVGDARPIVTSTVDLTALEPAIPTIMPTVDVSATAAASDCGMTPFSPQVPAEVDVDRYFGASTTWLQGDNIWLTPDPSFDGRWYAGGLLVAWQKAEGGTLTVTGRNLSGQAGDVRMEYAFGDPHVSGTVLAEMFFAAPGCWQILAQGDTMQLDAVVNVLPLETRPDVAVQLAQHATLQPYPVPASCPVTQIDGPGFLQPAVYGAPLSYWITGEGIEMDGEPNLLYEGENQLWFYPREWASPTLSGQLLGDAAVTLRSTGIRSSGAHGEHWKGDVLFSAPGCWKLHVVMGTQTLSAVVYVFPAECRIEPNAAAHSDVPVELPADCAAPQV